MKETTMRISFGKDQLAIAKIRVCGSVTKEKEREGERRQRQQKPLHSQS